MRKLFLSVLLFSSTATSLLAQLQVGVRTGVHWSTVRYTRDGVSNHGFLPGFTATVPVQWALTEHWAIRAEPSFIQKGWSSKVDYTDDGGMPAGRGKMTIRYGVAELPLLASFRTKVRNGLTYYGVLGPSIGYVLGGRLRITEGTTEVFRDKLLFDKRFTTGIWAGGGMEVPIGGLVTFWDARYQYGIRRDLPFAYKGVMHGVTVSVGCWLPGNK